MGIIVTIEDEDYNIDEICSIDPNNLDNAMSEQPGYFAYFTAILAKYKANEKNLYADLDLEIRNTLTKPTEAKVKAAINRRPEYKEAYQARETLEGIVEALKQRSSMLRGIVQNRQIEYWNSSNNIENTPKPFTNIINKIRETKEGVE